MKKIVYYGTLLFYLIGMTTGLILVEFNLTEFPTDFSIEKLLFIIFNLFVIAYLALYTRKLHNGNKKWLSSIRIIIGYIIYLGIDLYIQIEKATRIYEFSEDLTMSIGTMLIKPSGFMVSAMIPLILLLVAMDYVEDKSS